MNTVMSNKYDKMHTDVLELCSAHGIRMIPGRRVTHEILGGSDISGIKEFLLLPDDMDKFMEVCADELKNGGYLVVKGKVKNSDICRIYRPDMLAANISGLMKNPDGKFYPQLLIRRVGEEDGKYTFTANGKTTVFETAALDDLVKTAYKNSYVYMKPDGIRHLTEICGAEGDDRAPAAGYALFDENLSADDFIAEAKSRGYLSPERIERYNEYTAWKKENRSEIEKKYREYQEVLLGLKQP